MDLAWLVAIGAFLLVAGLTALAYDTVRRKQGGSPYPFPENTTNLLDETAVQRIISQQTGGQVPARSTSTMASASLAQAPGRRRLSLPGVQRLAGKLPGRHTATGTGTGAVPASTRRRSFGVTRLRLIALCVVAAIVAVGTLVATLVVKANPAPLPEGTAVVGICEFVGAPLKNDIVSRLGDDLLNAAASGGAGNLVVRSSALRPSGREQAEAERTRMGADFLIWGDIGPTGAMTANITIAPGFRLGQQPWQRFTDPDPGALVFPRYSEVHLLPTQGTDPLVPLALSLIYAKLGDYPAATKAAWGAQATIEGGGGQASLGRFTESTARAAKGEYSAANDLFGKLEVARNMTPEALANRAQARLQLGDYSGAQADVDRAMGDRDASDTVLARAYLARAKVRDHSGDLTGAVTDLDQAIKLDPSYLPAHLRKAEVLYRQSQPDTALDELQALTRQAPDAAPAYRLTGLVKMMLGKPEDALSPLAQSARIYEGWVGGLRKEEGQAQASGDNERAQAATDGILALNRELAAAYLYRGMAYADKAHTEAPETFFGGIWRHIRGQPTTYELAISSMEDAARLDPHRVDVLLQLGSVYTLMGDTGKAAETLQRALALDPSAPEPYMALAQLQQKQGNAREAIKTLENLLAHSPEYYPAYEAIYNLYTGLQDKPSAQTALQRALQIPAQTPSDHLWHGKFLRTLGDNNGAVAELQAAAQDSELWEAHLYLGETLSALGQAPAALDEYRKVLAVQPNNPTALLGAARLLVLAGESDEAAELYGRLVTYAPDVVEGHTEYSQLLLSRGDAERAVAEAKRAVQLDDKSAGTHFCLALAYEAKKDWPNASQQFAATTQRDPTHFEAFIRLAASLFREDRYADSLQASQAAMKLRADDPQSYRWQAEARFALGDARSALESLGSALNIQPQYADALALTARAYSRLGDEASAVAYSQKATAAAPSSPAGSLALGETCLAAGKGSEALQAYGAALQITPNLPDALVGQGRAYELMGDRQKAVTQYTKALQTDPGFADAYLYAGQTYTEAGSMDDALHEYRTAVQMRPNWPLALYYLGRAYLQRKDLGNAHAAFQRATQYSPNMVEAWFGLGMTAREQGNSSEAIQALSRAVQKNANYADAWLYLGLTYEESGDRARAADAFTHARDTASDPNVKQQAEKGLDRVK